MQKVEILTLETCRDKILENCRDKREKLRGKTKLLAIISLVVKEEPLFLKEVLFLKVRWIERIIFHFQVDICSLIILIALRELHSYTL